MRFREESKGAIIAWITRILIFVVFGGSLLLFANSLHTGNGQVILENICLLAAICYMCIRIYLVDARRTRSDEASRFLPLTASRSDDRELLPKEEGSERTALQHELQHRLKRAKRGSKVTVCLLHVNPFKTIRSILGGKSGQKLLNFVGLQVQNCCLASEIFYRTGMDDFAIIMDGYANEEDILQRVGQLVSLLEHSVTLKGTEYHVTFSCGIAIYPADGSKSDQLIRHAELAAAYSQMHRMEISRYDSKMKTLALSKLELENDLRRGLEREEFFLEYQPQVHLQSGKIVGLEALVRWNHPKRGKVPPADFIPLAEECGLIVDLGEWVLRTACRQNKQWQEEGYEPISVSVNLSMRQFRDARFADLVAGVLKETGLEAKYLELEITESMTMDKKSAYEQLRELKKLGIFISIDDFGTGYSSLHYLKNLPIDRIKIDRSFLEELVHDGHDAAIVSTIARMAHHLKLKVTAEGVENYEQLEFLKLQNCHEGQGYLFSRPVSAAQMQQNFLVKTAV